MAERQIYRMFYQSLALYLRRYFWTVTVMSLRDSIEDEMDARQILDEESWQEGGRRPSTFTFVSRAGSNKNVLHVLEENTLSCLEYFDSIVSGTILSKIEDERNNYATHCLQNHQNLPPFSKLRNSTNTSVPEMKSFLGITLAMGIVIQLDIQDYWSTNVVFSTPFLNTIMSRNRIHALISFLHLSDKNIAVLRDNQFILRYYVPGPDKPCKYVLKMYMLCDSANGYCSRMELYTGRDGQKQPPSQYGATYELVLRLVSLYMNKGHHIYMDNYFSSPQLFYELYMYTVPASNSNMWHCRVKQTWYSTKIEESTSN